MILKPPKNQQKKLSNNKKKSPKKSNFYQALRYTTLEGRRMVKENRLCKLMKRIYMRLKVIMWTGWLIRTIFLKIWRCDIDSRSPSLFLKVEATRILAIAFLNDQNCRKKQSKLNDVHIKALTVKFTIAHIKKHNVLFVICLFFSDVPAN